MEETIPYRKSKLHVKTIPKGTLLFRLVKHPEDDFRGPKLQDGTRCLTPHYHAYFYPNPFMGKLSIDLWATHYNKIRVYRTVKDIKVLSLVLPSKYNRRHRNTRRTFIKSCKKVDKGCLPYPMQHYNPCFSETLVKKHPDIVGIMSIAKSDAVRLSENIKRGKTQRRTLKYYHDAEDSEGNKAPPELAIHPMTSRPSKDVITESEDEIKNNYELLTTMKTDDIDKLVNYMEKHAVYNPETYYYTYKE
jgi:hypothetical protein